MKDSEFNTDDMDFDAFDEAVNPPPETTDFDDVVEEALSRRGFLGGVMAFGAGSFVLGTSALTPTEAKAATSRLGFAQVAANTLDTITLPEGYSSQVVVRWGDPMFSGVAEFDQATRGNATSQAGAYGDNIDGMSLFEVDGKSILVNNNEYTNRKIIWGNNPDGKAATDDDILKGKMAHGVSVLEVAKGDNGWELIVDSPLNRRITPDTEMAITGPAAGHDLMKTAADPTGTVTLGTWNNCGNGKTPWGTYLACEENFNGYFSSSNPDIERSAEQKRYGVNTEDWGYGWAKIDERFDIAKHANEANRAGYVVEIDPSDPTSTPKKRTALGRFKHENAEVVVNADGHIVVYLGDDERGEFLYRFVSAGVYAEGADNSDLLEDGDLYVAKFYPDGTGEWLALTPEATGMSSKAEICVFTRLAASAVGATTMDRPEWVAANPKKAELYCALTNNKNRGIKTNAGGDATPVGGPNPREGNKYGQIVRWWPAGANHASDSFTWDLFALAGNPTIHEDAKGGSVNINDGNMFNSPDGLIFDSKGLLWIQTDGNYSNEEDFAGMGNNQMLVFVGIQHPGERGDSHWPDGGTTVPRSAVIAVTRDDGGQLG